MRVHYLVHRQLHFHGVLSWLRHRALFGVSFIRALIPPDHFPKGHTSWYYHIGGLVLTYELEGTQIFSPQQTWLFLTLFYSWGIYGSEKLMNISTFGSLGSAIWFAYPKSKNIFCYNKLINRNFPWFSWLTVPSNSLRWEKNNLKQFCGHRLNEAIGLNWTVLYAHSAKLLACVDTVIVLSTLKKISHDIPISQKNRNREDQVSPSSRRRLLALTVLGFPLDFSQ